MSETYTVARVAEILGIDRHSVTTLIQRGELRASNVSLCPGKQARWRVTGEALEDFLRRRENRPEPRRTRRPARPHVKEYV